MKRFLAGLALVALTVPGFAADEKQQTELLRKLFRQPHAQWSETLKQNRELLDDSFFERCEARIQWDLRNNQFEDAHQFAEVGDLAAALMGKPVHFQAELPKK